MENFKIKRQCTNASNINTLADLKMERKMAEESLNKR